MDDFLASLPTVRLDQKQLLPTTPCVYFALTAENEVLYIGASVHPKKRWRQHSHYDLCLYYGCSKIGYIPSELHELLNKESEMIQRFLPALNVYKHTGAKAQIVIVLDHEALKQFRAGCILRDSTPTQEITRLVRAQLEEWLVQDNIQRTGQCAQKIVDEKVLGKPSLGG